MVRKEKKSYSRSKKFDEIQQDRKLKLNERAVQKKTGYERDIRTMMRRIMEPVRLAETGEGQITREDLLLTKLKIEKLITRIRVLSGNKGANLSKIKSVVEMQRAIIVDYMHDKRELKGKVVQYGDSTYTAESTPANNGSNGERPKSVAGGQTGKEFVNMGFETSKPSNTTSKKELYKNLGFDVGDEDDEDVFPEPERPKAGPTPIIIESTEKRAQASEASFQRMSLTLIDDKISKVINDGIEHLMHFRRKRKMDAPSYRDEILRFIEHEISFEKSKTLQDLKAKGHSEDSIREFSELFDSEFETNKTLMIRKCLYLSRVLEYRKGSTASG